MNPYDFVRIDWSRPPERRRPAWHHRFTDAQGQQLYSGRLEVGVYAETPLFIIDPHSSSLDLRKPALSLQNRQGEYILPGSSLKGMLRCVVESLANGCLTLYAGRYERDKVHYEGKVQEEFRHCHSNAELCIACRLFGMLKEGARGVFLGKVNIGDACAYSDKVYLYDKPIYTLPLMEPKPHHASFYLDESGRYIAGRKYYFHHSRDKELLSENKIILMGGRPANRYIRPLDYGTQFHFALDFTGLAPDEFSAMIYAIALEDSMRHKIGYAKPMGLGSVALTPTRLKLVDYAERYTQSAGARGINVLEGDELWDFLDERIDEFKQRWLLELALQDLRRIWRWPPDPNVDYYYPDKDDWFDTPDSIGKRIADTRHVP